MNLFKSASTSSGPGRPKSKTGQSIRGKISGPIPIPHPADDDEFPIRNPGSNIASSTPDDEFPIRQAEAGIASQTPLEEPPPSQDIREPQAASEAQVDGAPALVPASTPESSPQDEPAAISAPADRSLPNHAPPLAPPPPPPTSTWTPPSGSVPAPTLAPPHPPPTAPPAPSTPVAPSAPAPAPMPSTPVMSQATPLVRVSPSSGTGTTPSHKRGNASSTLRYSVASNTSANTGNGDRPQRKKSTLRGALSKLFGRKKKKAGSQFSGGDTDRTSSVVPSQHRSDISMLERVKEGEPKRSTSLPITEYDRALRSHSVGPNDITAIESVRNSMHADTLTGRRRAATATHSHLFGARAHSRRHELGEWAGLSPRPASTHGRTSRTLVGDEDPDSIGRAITSDIGGEYAHKRRSRSLSGLDIAVLSGSSDAVRRRSDEIRYWRESYGPSYLSPLSSTHPDTDGDRHTEYNDNEDTAVLSVDLSHTPSIPRAMGQGAPTTPPQPFNFGTFATMNEMAGMKITQAVGLDVRMGNLESRTNRLERVVDQLCHSVPGFKGPLSNFSSSHDPTVPRSVPATGIDPPSTSYSFGTGPTAPGSFHPVTHQAISLGPGGTDAATSRYSNSRQSIDTEGYASHLSFGEGQTYIGSLHPPSSSATQALSIPAVSSQQQSTSTSPALRPTSTSTVRGATSLPALAAAAGAGHASLSSVDALTAQLEAERAARAALEQQVKKLSERMNTLSTTMFAMLRDPHRSKSHERLSPSSAAGEGKQSGTVTPARSLSNTPTKLPRPSTSREGKPSLAPVSISLEGTGRPPLPQGPNVGVIKPSIVKTISVFEDDGDDSERESRRGREAEQSPTDDEAFSDAFQTPREERSPHPYGAFGEELRDETDDDSDPKRKKAARTLSLSQLTVGKGKKTVI